MLSAPVRWQKGDLCGYLRVRILRGHIDYTTPETVQEGTEGTGLQWGSSASIYTVYSLMTWMTGGSHKWKSSDRQTNTCCHTCRTEKEHS